MGTYVSHKKHDSYVDPPNKPFFRHSKRKENEPKKGMSPAKIIQLRSELIELLGKWHSLMEKEVVSTDQFKEMKENIVSDLKKY